MKAPAISLRSLPGQREKMAGRAIKNEKAAYDLAGKKIKRLLKG
jgi:hypothetical protein